MVLADSHDFGYKHISAWTNHSDLQDGGFWLAMGRSHVTLEFGGEWSQPQSHQKTWE